MDKYALLLIVKEKHSQRNCVRLSKSDAVGIFCYRDGSCMLRDCNCCTRVGLKPPSHWQKTHLLCGGIIAGVQENPPAGVLVHVWLRGSLLERTRALMHHFEPRPSASTAAHLSQRCPSVSVRQPGKKHAAELFVCLSFGRATNFSVCRPACTCLHICCSVRMQVKALESWIQAATIHFREDSQRQVYSRRICHTHVYIKVSCKHSVLLSECYRWIYLTNQVSRINVK